MNDEREKRKRPPRGAAFCVCLAERGAASAIIHGAACRITTPLKSSNSKSFIASGGITK